MSDQNASLAGGVAPSVKPRPKKENQWLSLLFNIVLPALVLSKLSRPDRFGPTLSLIVAVSIPIIYFVWDLWTRRQFNWLSVFGIVSVLLTGGLGLLKLGGFWFAVKDSSIPALIGIAALVSIRMRRPLVRVFLYNDQVIDIARVDAELQARDSRPSFERLLSATTLILALSFFLSAVLNFGLAYTLLKSPGGSVAFNEELGRKTALSYPVVVLPCMALMSLALWRLLSGIKKLTGLSLEQVFRS